MAFHLKIHLPTQASVWGSWLDSFYTGHICTINSKTFLQHRALRRDFTVLLSLTQSAVLTPELGVGHQSDNQAPRAGGASVSRPESHQLASQATIIGRQTWTPDILFFKTVCDIENQIDFPVFLGYFLISHLFFFFYHP